MGEKISLGEVGASPVSEFVKRYIDFRNGKIFESMGICILFYFSIFTLSVIEVIEDYTQGLSIFITCKIKIYYCRQ